MRGYTPNDDILHRLKAKCLVGVVGPSAGGKTTIVRQAVEQDPSLKVIVSTTSRAMRPGEQDGEEYHFRTRDEIEQRTRAQEYVNVAPSLIGDYYVTDPDDYPSAGTGIVAIWANAIPYFKKLPFKSFRIIFVVPPAFDVWKERLIARGWEADVLHKRLLEIEESLLFALTTPCDLILNDDLAQATNDFLAAVHRPAHASMPNQIAIKQHVGELLQAVKQFRP